MSYLTQCGILLKKHDPDRFFLSLFAPADMQSAFWALGMFNHEIAKTREVVTSSTMGLIRLQWWRDAFTRWYEKGIATKHEVLDELLLAIEKYKLPYDLFEKLLVAREQDLHDEIADIENYARDTSAPLFELYSVILAHARISENRAQDSRFCGDDVERLATSYALVGLARTGQYKGAINTQKQKFKSRYFRAVQAFVELYTQAPQKIPKFKELRVWAGSFL
ncbi:MAG: hypothetical protein GC136_10515 [Alphaproteobacteria bacterium]|nr:hypothetical protein [Alphaproteobacteria bacterium]